MPSSETELLERWRQGDRRSAHELVCRYEVVLRRFFRSKVPGDYDDLVQETLRIFVEQLDHIEDADKFRSYLFSIAHNILFSHLRGKHRLGSDIDLDEIEVSDLSPDPSEILEQKRNERLLVEALKELPIQDQALLALFYWEQMKLSDISESLHISTNTLKQRLHRARLQLSRALAKLEDVKLEDEESAESLEEWLQRARRHLGRSQD